MSRITTVTLLVGGFILVAGAYQAGRLNGRAAMSTTMPAKTEPDTLQEIAAQESVFDQQQAALGNRVADVKNRIKTVKLNLGLNETDNKVQATQIAERLAALDERLLAMNAATEATANPITNPTGTRADVPFPPDSPAGRLQHQPRAESGIPVSVLQHYEQETGISPDEIESLMHRTP